MSLFIYHTGVIVVPKFLRQSDSRYNTYTTVQPARKGSCIVFLIEPNSQHVVDGLSDEMSDMKPIVTNITAKAVVMRVKTKCVSLVETKFGSNLDDPMDWRELQLGIARELSDNVFNCFGYSQDETISAAIMRAKQKELPLKDLIQGLKKLGSFKDSDYQVVTIDDMLKDMTEKIKAMK